MHPMIRHPPSASSILPRNKGAKLSFTNAEPQGIRRVKPITLPREEPLFHETTLFRESRMQHRSCSGGSLDSIIVSGPSSKNLPILGGNFCQSHCLNFMLIRDSTSPRQLSQVFQLPLGRRPISMTWQHTIKRQLQRTMNAAASLRIVLIQIRRSDPRSKSKGGKQIPTKQQPMPCRVVAAVSMRMPRQRHHAKTSPDGKLIAIIEQTIRLERRLAQQSVPRPFRHTRDTSKAGVTRASLIMLQIALWPCNPRRVLCSKRRHIPHMIQMTMREQNATNRQRLPPTRH